MDMKARIMKDTSNEQVTFEIWGRGIKITVENRLFTDVQKAVSKIKSVAKRLGITITEYRYEESTGYSCKLYNV